MQMMTKARRTGRMLGVEEEKELHARYMSGDTQAGNTLVEAHMALIHKIAGRSSRFGPAHDDAVQEGVVGFMQGLIRFDPTLGFRINTFCRWWIRAAVIEWARAHHSLIKIGTTQAQKKAFGSMAEIKAKLGIYSDHLGGEEARRVAAALGMEVADVEEMSVRLSPGAITSLNSPLGVEGTSTSERLDEVVDERSLPAEIEEAIDEERRRGALTGALGMLDARKRDIVQRRYLNEDQDTLEDLSITYGVSRERIRQLEVQAIDEMAMALPAALSRLAGQERRSARRL